MNRALPIMRAFHFQAAAEQIIDRPIPVTYRRQPAATQIDVLEIIRAGLGVNRAARRLRLVRVNVLHTAILIGMAQKPSAILGRTVERQALRIGTGRVIGKAERILDVEAGTVAPNNARIRPEITFVSVRILIRDSVHAHCK